MRDALHSYQSHLPEPDDGGMLCTAIVLAVVMVSSAAVGVFIGWLTFSPLTIDHDCGSVETCTVFAEGGGEK